MKEIFHLNSFKFLLRSTNLLIIYFNYLFASANTFIIVLVLRIVIHAYAIIKTFYAYLVLEKMFQLAHSKRLLVDRMLSFHN